MGARQEGDRFGKMPAKRRKLSVWVRQTNLGLARSRTRSIRRIRARLSRDLPIWMRPASPREALSPQMDTHSKCKKRPAMKKNSTTSESQRIAKRSNGEISKSSQNEQLTIGLDLGDRMSHYCILNAWQLVIRDKVTLRRRCQAHRKGGGTADRSRYRIFRKTGDAIYISRRALPSRD